MHVQVRTLSNNIALRPVVELFPEDLGGADTASAERWISLLDAAGISVAGEIIPDSWLVYADDIQSPRALRTLARAHLGSADGPGLMSALSESALQGGFVLVDGDDVVLAPGCCGHLGHIASWRRAAAHRGADKLRLYIGHPEVSVSFEGGFLCVHEAFDAEHQNKPKTLRVSPHPFAAAVSDASARVAELMTRVRAAIRSPRKPPQPPLNGMTVG